MIPHIFDIIIKYLRHEIRSIKHNDYQKVIMVYS